MLIENIDFCPEMLIRVYIEIEQRFSPRTAQKSLVD